MPMFRQGSVGLVALGQVTPVTGARAGTVNDAGGLTTNIDCRNYKNVTLCVSRGVVGTSIDAKVQSATASGGSYADITGGAITQITAAGAPVMLDVEIPVGRPWLQIVVVTVGSTTAAGAILFGHDPTGVNRP